MTASGPVHSQGPTDGPGRMRRASIPPWDGWKTSRARLVWAGRAGTQPVVADFMYRSHVSRYLEGTAGTSTLYSLVYISMRTCHKCSGATLSDLIYPDIFNSIMHQFRSVQLSHTIEGIEKIRDSKDSVKVRANFSNWGHGVDQVYLGYNDNKSPHH